MLHDVIKQHASTQPDHLAIEGDHIALDYRGLYSEIALAQSMLVQHIHNRTTAIAIDNSPAWAILDIAAMANKIPTVPLPSFFSDDQIKHAIQNAGIGAIVTDEPARFRGLLSPDTFIQTTNCEVGQKPLTIFLLNISATDAQIPNNTIKITYTSGTTGQPKGVCLSEENMLRVADSIAQSVKLTSEYQHLCILPLATLLENIAGLYATFLAGGTAHILSSQQVGFKGSSFDIKLLHNALKLSRANTAILIPELLTALVTFIENGAATLNDLDFLAVGGASVSPSLIARAQAIGLPIYEGYGLSESASVVALNTPAFNQVGSVGKVLPHLQIKVTTSNEIFIKGANYLGYTHASTQAPAEGNHNAWLDTGDIGYVDDKGFLYISGRKKNIFITSFGRNVSPEWVERDLTSSPLIQQACLFGEAKPWNTAVIFTPHVENTHLIDEEIIKLNASLPDYARVSKYLLTSKPFSVENNQLTPNGRLKRQEIWNAYHTSINQLYLS